MSETTVVNVKTHPCQEYIGRPFGKYKGHPGTFGNPFRPGGKPVEELTKFIRTSRLTVGVRMHFEARLENDGWRALLARSDPLEAFHLYLMDRWRVDYAWRQQVQALPGKVLGCWCKPGPCHGDVLASFLDAHERRTP
jgi:hypothetical protein